MFYRRCESALFFFSFILLLRSTVSSHLHYALSQFASISFRCQFLICIFVLFRRVWIMRATILPNAVFHIAHLRAHWNRQVIIIINILLTTTTVNHTWDLSFDEKESELHQTTSNGNATQLNSTQLNQVYLHFFLFLFFFFYFHYYYHHHHHYHHEIWYFATYFSCFAFIFQNVKYSNVAQSVWDVERLIEVNFKETEALNADVLNFNCIRAVISRFVRCFSQSHHFGSSGGTIQMRWTWNSSYFR